MRGAVLPSVKPPSSIVRFTFFSLPSHYLAKFIGHIREPSLRISSDSLPCFDLMIFFFSYSTLRCTNSFFGTIEDIRLQKEGAHCFGRHPRGVSHCVGRVCFRIEEASSEFSLSFREFSERILGQRFLTCGPGS